MTKYDCSSAMICHHEGGWLLFRCKRNLVWPEAAVWPLGPAGLCPGTGSCNKEFLLSQNCNLQMVGFDLQTLSQHNNFTAAGETSGRCVVYQEDSSAGKQFSGALH